VRAGREIARSSGTGTMAGSTTSAMESSRDSMAMAV